MRSVERDADGGLTVALPVASERWLERLLLRVGPEAEVVAPAELAGVGRAAAAGCWRATAARCSWRVRQVGVQRGAVPDAGLGEQVGQGSGGRLGVGQGIVRPAASYPVARADVVERVALLAIGVERAGQLEGAELRHRRSVQGGAPERPAQEGPVEAGVVGDEHGAAQSPSELGGHGRERGRPPDPAPRDAVQPPWADPPRPDIGAPAVHHVCRRPAR